MHARIHTYTHTTHTHLHYLALEAPRHPSRHSLAYNHDEAAIPTQTNKPKSAGALCFLFFSQLSEKITLTITRLNWEEQLSVLLLESSKFSQAIDFHIVHKFTKYHPGQKKLGKPCMPKYRRVHARESTHLYPRARSCLNFFGQGSIRKLHSGVHSALWHGKVSALVVLQVLATKACGIKLAFAMCLLQCLHCTDEAHIGRNRGTLYAV